MCAVGVTQAIDHTTQVLSLRYNRQQPVIFNTYQAYLKDSHTRLLEDMERARREKYKFAAKLVSGPQLTNSVSSHLTCVQQPSKGKQHLQMMPLVGFWGSWRWLPPHVLITLALLAFITRGFTAFFLYRHRHSISPLMLRCGKTKLWSHLSIMQDDIWWATTAVCWGGGRAAGHAGWPHLCGLACWL